MSEKQLLIKLLDDIISNLDISSEDKDDLWRTLQKITEKLKDN